LNARKEGIASGLATGALWGFPFLVPKLNSAFAPGTIALGRFFFYAIASAVALSFWLGKGENRAAILKPKHLLVALFFGLIGNGLYYTLVVYSVQRIGIPSSSLIIGLIPLAVALAGIRSRRELQNALFPLLLIAAGIGLLHHNILSDGIFDSRGFASAFAALALWSAFAVMNSAYLKKNPEIQDAAWSSCIGIGSLLSLVAILPFFDHGIVLDQFVLACFTKNWTFLGWAILLGLGSSWFANALWNRASQLLPTSLLGQLIVSETLFALLYGFIYEQRLPAMTEALAAALMLGGVMLGIRRI
jgi:drug/metabolite transporter (DMT)-like permease